MKILITGASGYIGAKLFEDLSKYHNVIGTYQSNKIICELKKLDITDLRKVLKITSKVSPDLIIHTAAIPKRELCEKDPSIAFDINVKGTENVIVAANENKAKLFFISSIGAINPITVYGKTKSKAEKIVINSRIEYNILRLSVTFGYSPNIQNDRPFNKIIRTLREGMPNSYDNSWKFPPTYLRQVSETIQVLLDKKINNRIITIAIPELKSMFDIASDILKPFGKIIEPKDCCKELIEDLPKLNNECVIPRYTYKEMIQAILMEIKNNNLI